MITQEYINEVRNSLEKAERPLFFFDDDNDGLCSFILFRNFTKNGKGITVKTSPSLDVNFLDKVKEYNPDFVFILDKPIVSQEFLDKVHVPVVWIDHHDILKREGVTYFNPKMIGWHKPSSTTEICFKIVGGEMWIAAIGAISDWSIPEFFEEVKNEYPDLFGEKDNPKDILYGSKFGELCRIFSFINKGKISDFNESLSALLKVKDPHEILEQKTENGKFVFNQVSRVAKIYQGILENAKNTEIDEDLLLFVYEHDEFSFTADLSNELLCLHPNRLVIIVRETDEGMKMSLRSEKYKVKKILEKALKGIDGYGGGHDFACGGNVQKNDFPKFIEKIKEEMRKQP